MPRALSPADIRLPVIHRKEDGGDEDAEQMGVLDLLRGEIGLLELTGMVSSRK